MRQVSYSFPAPDYNGIAATQSWTTSTGSYVTLNGDLSQQIQGTVDPLQRFVELPGIQRTIGVFSTGNLSGVVFNVVGYDLRGVAVTATFAGASGGSSAATDSFATWVGEVHRVVSISATTAATSAFTIGTGATGSTNFMICDGFITPFSIQGTVVTATIAAVTPQSTSDNVQTSTAPTTFNHATGSLTANTQFTYTSPVQAVRFIVTTNTASGVGTTMSYQQAG